MSGLVCIAVAMASLRQPFQHHPCLAAVGRNQIDTEQRRNAIENPSHTRRSPAIDIVG
jgi:hypothetical protein